MPTLDFDRTRQFLQAFDFKSLFIEELGWSRPAKSQPAKFTVEGRVFTRTPLAELGGVPVFEVSAAEGAIPDSKTRKAAYNAVPQIEKLLIFVDAGRQNSVWYWVKREGNKAQAREHFYARSQPGDLFLGKLSAMLVDLGEIEQAGGALDVVTVLGRLRAALDVERVTRKFYADFEEERLAFADFIKGIDDERDRQWYTSVILNRLMFIYFLQRKGFLEDGNLNYLPDKLAASQKRGKDRFYRDFLKALFFEAFAKPEDQRSETTKRLTGNIKYLNGGLFLEHPVEERWPRIAIADAAFEALFKLFGRYSWNLDDTPGGRDDEINPAVLGYIFEKYINQKAFGAYYTRPEITEYLCERTIERVILDRINTPPEISEVLKTSEILKVRHFDSLPDLLMSLDADICRELLDYLPTLSLLDPACGSGAFLVSAMRTLISIYSALLGWIDVSGTKGLQRRKAEMLRGHPSAGYYIKKRIITDNLFGVDIMEEAVEIARLRLFLALVASAHTIDDLEPLPNVDFNLLAGNSLIGLLRVDEDEFNRKQQGLFSKNFRQLVEEKQAKLRTYKDTATYSSGLQSLRDEIQTLRETANESLNELLLNDFTELEIKFEQATWDEKNNEEDKPRKRAVRLDDVTALKPFHWGYEFDEVMNGRGGFDAIITNPPWEIFKPNAKEFFLDYSDVVTKKNMTIKEFEKEQAKLLKNKEVRAAWLDYLSRFPHVSAYYRAASQYANQIAIVNGKKAGSDINLYKLFAEQCYNLLRPGGLCGIIIPSGIYNDLGTKQLRELLFTQAKVDTLLGLSNERYIFEGVHHGFRLCLLTFSKGGQTNAFRAAFRINPREAVAPEELEAFLNTEDEHPTLSVSLIRKLSPDSLSVMEFKSELDTQIAQTILRWPLLGEKIEGAWRLHLSNEFHMTNDSQLFKTSPGKGRLPLYEGKMFHQFDHHHAEPKYWLIEKEARTELLNSRLAKIKRILKEAKLDAEVSEGDLRLDYETCRIAFRDVSASTNERTMIATVLPPRVFCPHTVSLEGVFEDAIVSGELKLNEALLTPAEQLFAVTIFNSFVMDYMIRQRVTGHVSFFYVYQLPVPRLIAKDSAFAPIVQRAAKLICTTPEFDELAKEVGLGSHKKGVTDTAGRAKLRAELDGLVANLYGLTEEEFAHILGTFPLVEESVKEAAMREFRAAGTIVAVR